MSHYEEKADYYKRQQYCPAAVKFVKLACELMSNFVAELSKRAG